MQGRTTPGRRRRVVSLVAALMSTTMVASGAAVDAAAVIASDVVDAGDPSISADGRFVVYGGLVGERRSVFRTDRASGDTIELSPVPDGVRPGHTIHPSLSADGCVVVAVTEIPYDLFRDDDRDVRWDVYRLVLPECDGRPNAWELVSSSERTGTARDDVFTDAPPTLSGSGAIIAYTHQAPDARPGVATISVVDLTVPLNEPGRVQQVAGMPVEAPNRSYLYRGATQPAISANGRHLAFRSDATASELLPGWANGRVLGEYATSQVYVWDRLAAEQRGAVHLVSGRDGMPAEHDAGSPSISEDGRIVAFVSADRTVVPAELPECRQVCPTQVYRFDRDTDGNGIFDEAPQVSPLSIVSAVDAGAVDVGVPRAGNESSWSPAVSGDGSQVAFVTDATNLLPSRRAGGGGPADGDLIVAEHHLGRLRRVLDGADATGVPGAHGNPAVSETGQVIVFDTMAAGPLAGVEHATSGGTRSVAVVEVRPQLSLASLDFGTVLLGFESTELYAQVLNAGPASFEPTRVESSSSNFRITGGSCTKGVIVAAGTSCSIHLTFNPTEPRAFSATLTVAGAGEGAPSVSTTLRGAAGEPALLANPGGLDLEPGVVGRSGGRGAVDVQNVGFMPTSIAKIEVGGAHPEDFAIVTQSCTDRALNPAASCTVEVEFRPTADGYRSGLLLVTATTGQYTSAVLGGTGRYDPVFRATSGRTRPSEELGIGGAGFPADVPVAIGFDGGDAPFATVTTNADGSFLTHVVIPGRIRFGERRLVASAPGGVVASWVLTVEGRPDRSMPVLPGFGLG